MPNTKVFRHFMKNNYQHNKWLVFCDWRNTLHKIFHFAVVR